MLNLTYFDGERPVKFAGWYCHPRLVAVSKLVPVVLNDGGKRITVERPQLDLDKLGARIIVYDRQAEKDFSKWLKAATEEEIWAARGELGASRGELGATDAALEINFFVPLDHYDKDDQHASMRLLTVSTNPDIVYPETLKLMSMHNCSTSKSKSVPALKGVKNLYLETVSNSLDFRHTNIDKLVIECVGLDGNPDKLNDYSAVYPELDFLVAHWNPPCTISCNGLIRVNYSAPTSARDKGSRPADSLTYNCTTLVIDRGTDGFTSTCKVLQMSPTFRFSSRDVDQVEFITPNLQRTVILCSQVDDTDDEDDSSDDDDDGEE